MGNSADPFRLGAIDTLVEMIPGAPGADFAVIMLGYKEQARGPMWPGPPRSPWH